MKTTEQMLAEAKALWVDVTVSAEPPKPTGEITLRPGIRRPPERDA